MKVVKSHPTTLRLDLIYNERCYVGGDRSIGIRPPGGKDVIMRQTSETRPSRLHSVLRGIVDDLQNESGAAIVSLYLYDAESESYYAPIAKGVPEAGAIAASMPGRPAIPR